jgi:universal stress protein A
MSAYSHILLATDGSAEHEAIGEHVRRLAHSFDARLSVLRVLDHLAFDFSIDPMLPDDVDKIEWFKESARDSLRIFAEHIGIDAAQTHVRVTPGPAQREIIGFAREHNVDLIVVGARERHGLAMFREDTMDKVAHNASCDVLVVHIESRVS